MIGSQFLISSLYITLIIGFIVTSPANLGNWMAVKNLVTSISFGLFLIFYTLVFTKLVLRLKTHYKVFYLQEKTRIFVISSLLLFSLVFRIVI